MARKDQQAGMVAVAAIVVSVLAHVVLWKVGGAVGFGGDAPALPRGQGVMQVSLVEPDRDADKPSVPPEPPQTDPPKPLVDLDYLTKEEPPPDAKYVAEFDNNPEKEYRAPKHRREAPSRGDREDAKDEPREQATAPTAVPRAGMALPLGGRDAASGDEASSRPGQDRDPQERPDGPARPGSLSPRGARGLPEALRKDWGTPGTHDALEDDLDVGPGNVLQTKRWKYASFFNRVRNGVAQHWHPEVVHAANDPDGRVYGTKTRKTRLLISLNPDGSLNRVRLDQSSNVGYLDEEAIRAVRQAAPFTNPPEGLVDEGSGLIQFGFGFIFEIDGGRRIFRYQQ